MPAAVELHGGSEHYCVVDPTRDVWCWGYHRVDIDANPMEREVVPPKRMGTLPEGGRLDVLRWGACIIDRSNRAQCWGAVSGFDFDEPPYSLDDVVDIVGGTDYTCMLSFGGALTCIEAGEQTPLALPLETPIIRLYGSTTWACALSEAGNVACWGEGVDQLGLGEAPLRLRPSTLAPAE